jgi:hypothetical protein
MLPKRRDATLLALVLLLCAASPALAQWTTLGDMPPPMRGGNTVTDLVVSIRQ